MGTQSNENYEDGTLWGPYSTDVGKIVSGILYMQLK